MLKVIEPKTVYVDRFGFPVFVPNLANHGSDSSQFVIYTNMVETHCSPRYSMFVLPVEEFKEKFTEFTQDRPDHWVRRVTLLVLGSPMVSYGFLAKVVENEDMILEYIEKATHRNGRYIENFDPAAGIEIKEGFNFYIENLSYESVEDSDGKEYGVLSADLYLPKTTTGSLAALLDPTLATEAHYFSSLQVDTEGNAPDGLNLLKVIYGPILVNTKTLFSV